LIHYTALPTAYTDLLRRYDDPVRWEYPAGFDHAQAVQRFQRFAKELAQLWGKQVKNETEVEIQDASFHSQILIPVRDGEFVVARFSNFGDMATFAEEVVVPDDLRQVLLALFDKHGYVYVEADILNQQYSGSNPGVTGIRDWWTRYFDWL